MSLSDSASGTSWAFTTLSASRRWPMRTIRLWLDAVWKEMVTDHPEADAANGYLGNTIKLRAMIVLSSNWWQP